MAFEGSAVGRVAQEITPALEAMGYDLVRVQLSGGQRPTLQIMAERRDGQAMTVDDCARISRDVSALLEGLRRAPGALTAVPVDPDGRRQPFPAAWRTTARRAVEDQVEDGQRRASAAWIPPVCTAVLRADAMVDLDDPASLEAWKHRTNRTAP